MPFTDHPILFLDGACGTNLQVMDIPASAWEGREGCNELLNVTAPGIIEALHRSFYEAGAMAVETNTFGASSIVLAEYGLEDRAREINAAAVACARRAAGGDPTDSSSAPSARPPSSPPSGISPSRRWPTRWAGRCARCWVRAWMP